MKYRIKERVGVFTIQVEKLEYETSKGKCTSWVDASADGQPMPSIIGSIAYGHCQCTDFDSLVEAKETVNGWQNKEKEEKQAIYHEI